MNTAETMMGDTFPVTNNVRAHTRTQTNSMRIGSPTIFLELILPSMQVNARQCTWHKSDKCSLVPPFSIFGDAKAIRWDKYAVIMTCRNYRNNYYTSGYFWSLVLTYYNFSVSFYLWSPRSHILSRQITGVRFVGLGMTGETTRKERMNNGQRRTLAGVMSETVQ